MQLIFGETMVEGVVLSMRMQCQMNESSCKQSETNKQAVESSCKQSEQTNKQ